MPRRSINGNDQLTEKFFEQCREYLAGKARLKTAAGRLGISVVKFQDRIRLALESGYLVLKGLRANKASMDLRSAWMDKFDQNVEVCIAEGSPDNETFAHFAAENLIWLLRTLLEQKKTITIGIVSGSCTGETIKQLVESRLWDELVSDANIRSTSVHVLALNVTPVDGWDLEGNANIAVLRLAMFLREKLPECACTPYGLTSALIIPENQRKAADITNKKLIEMADPALMSSKGGMSSLDLVITGVGTASSSVFQKVIKAAKIQEPKGMVGDVAFWPVDEAGNALELTRKGSKGKQETCLIYSAIRLDTLKKLVKKKAKVVVIARNMRRDADVDKTKAILAAVRGGYVNFLVTDRATADKL